MKLIPDKCPKCGDPWAWTIETMHTACSLGRDDDGDYDHDGGSHKDFPETMETIKDRNGRILVQCPGSHERYVKVEE